MLGSLWLGPRTLPWYIVFCLVGVGILASQLPRVTTVSIVRVLITFAIALLIMVTSFRRNRLGVSGPRGESMFVDLRDRILDQSGIPELPRGWHAESALASAGGTLFAGDFVTTEAGTGFVHMAPGHGEDDWHLCMAHGIAVPDTVFQVLVGGAAASAFIPVFKRYLAQDEENEAWRLTSSVINAGEM